MNACDIRIYIWKHAPKHEQFYPSNEIKSEAKRS